MSPEERALIDDTRRLANEATNEPWHDECGFNNGGIATRFFFIPGHNGNASVEMIAEDVAFIVHARPAAPALCDLAERLDAELQAARARIAELERKLSVAPKRSAHALVDPVECSRCVGSGVIALGRCGRCRGIGEIERCDK